MAAIPTDIEVEPARERSRVNEIIVIALAATALLLGLCLVSYHPNDPSWNAAGESSAQNWIGTIGANVAAALFQTIGLAAYLVPVLILAAAWRRFRAQRINAPIYQLLGLVIVVFSAAALLSLAHIRPLFDASVNAGGLAGVVISRALVSGLNTIGAAILLVAVAAVGVLLATNFSFAAAGQSLGGPFAALRTLPARFTAWRLVRRTNRELRRQHNLDGAAGNGNGDIPQVVDSEGKPLAHARVTAPESAEIASAFESFSAATSGKAMAAAAGVAAAPAKKSLFPSRGKTTPAAETAMVQEMLREASVKRKTESAETGSLPFEGRKISSKPPSDYQLPSLDFLNEAQVRPEQADDELLGMATKLAEKCREFNVTGQIKFICPGPVVTTYEFKPDPGVKYSRVTGLVDDLCIALEAESIRIDRLPGKPHVGIEVPNPERETIFLREVLESRQFRESESKLTLALGKTIDGINYRAHLTRWPHLLIAGATGTGKSVCLNSLVVSVLYKARPDEVKFIMIDPKRLELGLYADIPHLATPIITEPKKAANALKWAVSQMEQRYKQLAQWGVRNIDGYNHEVDRRNNVLDFDEEGQPWKTLPYIVIIIDELADLMMTCGADVEEAITRLAQMARAVGIHLVLATQRPSVDVITGLTKANFPSRIAFRVSSKVDSRTIIDSNGAEQLLGRGDMLFLPPGTSRLLRVHGAYLDENEVAKIVAHIKAQGGEPVYDETITQSEEESSDGEN